MTSIPRGASRIRIGASRLTKSNANTFVRARAHGLFLPRVSGSTSGTPPVDPSTLGGISPYVTRLPQVVFYIAHHRAELSGPNSYCKNLPLDILPRPASLIWEGICKNLMQEVLDRHISTQLSIKFEKKRMKSRFTRNLVHLTSSSGPLLFLENFYAMRALQTSFPLTSKEN